MAGRHKVFTAEKNTYILSKVFFIKIILVFLLLFTSLRNSYGEETIELTVHKRDNIINICKKYLKYPQKWPEIVRINKLTNPHLIYPGQKLIIPARLLKGVPVEGTITFIKGDVQVKTTDKGSWFTLFKGNKIKQGYAIKTGADSAVEITFDDGASFFVRDNTMIRVTIAHKGGLLFIRRFFLGIGRSVNKVKGATGNESRFEIKTPSATAAARGTEFRVVVDPAHSTRSEVLKGLVGVKGKRQEVLVNEGKGTVVRKGELPEKPRVLLPPPNVTNLKPIYKTLPLKFNFDTVTGALYYRPMLSSDSEFMDLVKEETIKPGKKFTVMSVDDGTYYLQSRSIDSLKLEGLPSGTALVKVRINPLPPFVQIPSHGREYRQKKMAFKWLKVHDAAQYHIQVAEDEGFKRIVDDRDDITESEYAVELDNNHKTYYFRVSSMAQDGYQAAWSDTIMFTTAPPPAIPSFGKPDMGWKEIQIRWRDLGPDITYRFQLARDKEFNEILVDQQLAKPETIIDRPDEPGTYYVRTQSIDSDGYTSEFSPPQALEIEDTFSYGLLGVLGIIVTGGILLLL